MTCRWTLVTARSAQICTASGCQEPVKHEKEEKKTRVTVTNAERVSQAFLIYLTMFNSRGKKDERRQEQRKKVLAPEGSGRRLRNLELKTRGNRLDDVRQHLGA
jgi:hypothetical protein